MKKLAVLVLTKNEIKNIAECLESAAFADELIVIDSGSDDGTVAAAEALGASVYQRAMDESGFAGQRNFAAQKATADWLFYLDADERITPELAIELKALQAKDDIDYTYEVLRINFVMRQRLRFGVFKPDWSYRLFPRGCVEWQGVVHEVAVSNKPKYRLHNSINHFTYGNWDRYMQTFNRYTTLMAEKNVKKGKRAGKLSVLLRPPFAFLQAYILRGGILDGYMGLIMALLHGFYTLVKYLKILQLQADNANSTR